MDAVWIPLVAVLALLCHTVSTSDTTEVIRAVGGSVTFRSHDTDRNPALWSFGDDPIATVPFEDPPEPIFFEDKFQARFGVSERGRALSISQLSLEDAGTYSVKINGKISTFTLRVYRELSEPTLSCEAQNCSGGSCSFSLRCSAPGDGFGNVSYSWRARGRPWDEGPAVLWGNRSAPEEPGPLTCTARNAVSSRNVTVTNPGGLCAGALSGSRVGIGVRAVAGIGVVALFLLLLVFFWKSKGWRKFHLSKSNPTDTVAAATAECTTVYAEVGPSQRRGPGGMNAKPRPGGSPTTIYSLVKRPEQAGAGTEENATMAGLELV